MASVHACVRACVCVSEQGYESVCVCVCLFAWLSVCLISGLYVRMHLSRQPIGLDPPVQNFLS